MPYPLAMPPPSPPETTLFSTQFSPIILDRANIGNNRNINVSKCSARCFVISNQLDYGK